MMVRTVDRYPLADNAVGHRGVRRGKKGRNQLEMCLKSEGKITNKSQV
ncbi:hypothetical protein [Acetivibrio mesophilus]|jgi:hypothetical protein|nr:hypothetical protein [Acetivibrio mesophilus]